MSAELCVGEENRGHGCPLLLNEKKTAGSSRNLPWEKVRAVNHRSREHLLEVGLRAGFLELLLRRFGFRLGSAFEHGLGRAFDQRLRVGQA